LFLGKATILPKIMYLLTKHDEMTVQDFKKHIKSSSTNISRALYGLWEQGYIEPKLRVKDKKFLVVFSLKNKNLKVS